ncbi:hypothetical protein DFJ74DRAFT_704675 [Hyaloraphidium curvatum]|nr:hypothetical protein DFJ74DRAFT_704675 [Hyaloraphidium curvatum]
MTGTARRDAFRELPEQVLFLLDTSNELLLPMSPEGLTRLEIFKGLLKRFLHIKHMLNSRHRFSLSYITETPSYILDFSTNQEEFAFMLDQVLQQGSLRPCGSFRLSSIAEVVLAHVPDLAPGGPAPTHVTRVILVVARTSCEMADLTAEEAKVLAGLFSTGRFFVDILLMHDSKVLPTQGNVLGTQALYDKLNAALDPMEVGYSFEVGRVTKRLADGMAKLLAHPCQRVLPQDNLTPLLNKPAPAPAPAPAQPPSNTPGSSAAPSAAPTPSPRTSPQPAQQRPQSTSPLPPLPPPQS